MDNKQTHYGFREIHYQVLKTQDGFAINHDGFYKIQ